MSTYPSKQNPFQRDMKSETRAVMRDFAGIFGASILGAIYAGAITRLPPVGLAAFVGVMVASLPQLYRRAHGIAAHTINTSFNYIGLGKLSEASRLLDSAESQPTFMWVRRLIDVQRAIIAMRKGEMAEARDRLDAAIARPLGIVEKTNSLYQIEGAYALRAFVRASLGEREGALEDIAAVRSRGNASLDALAKVALAEALVLEKAGERARLKELIDREETLLLEHTHPRERAIVRGLQRMLKASSKGSIYRQTAAPDDAAKEQEEPPLADWVAKVAPEVAPFVRVPRRSIDGSPAMIAASASLVPQAAAVRAVAEAHAARARPKRSAFLMWAPIAALSALVLGAVGWMLSAINSVNLPDGSLTVGSSLSPFFWIVPLIVISIAGIAAVGITAAKRSGARKAPKGGGSSKRVDVRSDASSAQGLTALAMGPSDVAAAQARLVLAGNAERRGDFAAVITECRLGIGRLDDPKSRAQADILYPDLIALCAFALAASGQNDEADAELALLNPAYPHHARAVFRVRLVQCLRKRDIAAAARWVEQGAADLPLSIREELLADLVRALHAPESAGAGEVERIKDELRRSPERRKWLDTASPGIVAMFEQSGQSEADDPHAFAAVAPPPGAPRLRVDPSLSGASNAGAAGGPSRAAAGAHDDPAMAAELEARAEAEADQAAFGDGFVRRRGA